MANTQKLENLRKKAIAFCEAMETTDIESLPLEVKRGLSRGKKLIDAAESEWYMAEIGDENE